MAKSDTEFSGFVKVHGAREHKLKNVTLDIARNALVVFTGISGSGKSSLAFGTLHAEAQRRHLESVSPYANIKPALITVVIYLFAVHLYAQDKSFPSNLYV